MCSLSMIDCDWQAKLQGMQAVHITFILCIDKTDVCDCLQSCELVDGQLWGPWVAGEAAGDAGSALPGKIAGKVRTWCVLCKVCL